MAASGQNPWPPPGRFSCPLSVRDELERVHLITLATADGHLAQRFATTAGQKTILTALQLTEPARFFDFTLPSD